MIEFLLVAIFLIDGREFSVQELYKTLEECKARAEQIVSDMPEGIAAKLQCWEVFNEKEEA